MKEQDGAAAVVAAGKPLKTITLGELLAWPFPDREDLVAPWLRQGESAMLFAASGLGKTMLALTLALAVAGGGRVLGWSSPKPRSVLYVDGEMHAQDLRDRLALLTETVDGCDLGAASGNLALLSRQMQGASVKFPDLAKAEDQDEVLRRAADIGAELVILDNFSTLAEVADENEAAAMTPVLGFLLRMKQAGRACLLVHHSGKTGTDYRGSSKLATTFEVIIGLQRMDGRTASDGAGFGLTWTKYRGVPTEATRDMEVSLEGPGPDGSGGHRWQHTPAASLDLTVLLDAVRTGTYGTQKALAEAIGWEPSKVSRTKLKAFQRGLMREPEWEACLKEAAGADF